MSRHSSQKRRRVASIARNSARDTLTSKIRVPQSYENSSPVRLLPRPDRASTRMDSDARRTDWEHYVRSAQAALDMGYDPDKVSRRALKSTDDDGTEELLSGRVMELSERLAKALTELHAWLRMVDNRRSVLTSRNRGDERVRKATRIADHPDSRLLGRKAVLALRRPKPLPISLDRQPKR